jgi:excisionase family DNA binding protein
MTTQASISKPRPKLDLKQIHADFEESKQPRLMRVCDVARELACSRSSVYRWLESGILKGARIGGVVRLYRQSVKAYLDGAGE